MMRTSADQIELPTVGRFIVLPAGSFVMGNEKSVADWDGEVRPEHERNGPERLVQVTKSVAILDTPVTVAAFRAVAVEVPAGAEVFSLPASGSITDRWERRPFWHVNTSSRAPVVGVTWDDARAFCRACSTRLGVAIRLPTEVEWEYACRAGTTSLYF